MFSIQFNNVEQLNVVLMSLTKLQSDASMAVMEHIRKQAEEQYSRISSQDASVVISVTSSDDSVS